MPHIYMDLRVLPAALLAVLSIAVSAPAEVRVQGGGATFPAEIYDRWVLEYQKLHPDTKVDYVASGSGAGIKAFIERKLDFAATDAPMSHKEMERAGGEDLLVEIPTAAGAVVMSYNIPGFMGELRLDGPTLADIYLGRVKKWNDPRLTRLNPGADLPDLPITAIYRSDSSGTNFIFTHYLCEQSDDFDSKVGPSKLVTWPVGTGAKGNDGVIQLVSATRGAIGYVDLPVALKNNVPFAVLKNKDGQFVKATAETVSFAGEAAAADMHGDIVAANIWDQHGDNVYPISSFTYLVIYKDLTYLKNPAKAQALCDFLNWATTDGEAFASELHYAPLGPAARAAVHAALSNPTLAGKPTSGGSSPATQPSLPRK